MESLSVRHYSQTRRPWRVFQLHANTANTVQLEEATKRPTFHTFIQELAVWCEGEEKYRVELLRRGKPSVDWCLDSVWSTWMEEPAEKKKIRRGAVIWRNERFLETLMPRLRFFRGVVLMNARDPIINTPWKLCSDKVIMKSWKPRN